MEKDYKEFKQKEEQQKREKLMKNKEIYDKWING